MKEKIEQIEKKLKNRHNLTLKGYVHNKELSLEDFVEKLLLSLVFKHTTLYKGGGTQTPKAKHRSLGDIYKICKSYYPECSLHNLLSILWCLCFNERVIDIMYCGGIEKMTYFKRGDLGYFSSPDYQKDEYEISIGEYRNYFDLL